MTVSDSASEILPSLYAQWVADLLGGPIPRETRATCDDCAMCPSSGELPGPRDYFFNPVVKCCTYVPELHNFLTGRILSDTDPGSQVGRATVEQRIKERVAVTPLGLLRPSVHSVLYEHGNHAFGRSRTLRCPHYLEDGGRCGVWRNRESTCVTWFCKHVKGGVGRAFWIDALHQLLSAVEQDLARWCVLELCSNDDLLGHLVRDDAWTAEDETISGEAMDHNVDPAAYGRVWGEWRGREHEFYCRCANLVDGLSWADVLAISGPVARAYARLTTRAYAKLISDDIPRELTVGSFHVVQIQRARSRVSTYNDFDPLDVPQTLMELLPYFDGRPTDQALAAITAERNIRLEPDLVRKMVDFGLLVKPEEPVA